MNTIVNTNPPKTDVSGPIFRPRSNVGLGTSGQLAGDYARPLLLIGREPDISGLPSRLALHLMDALIPISWQRLEEATEEHQVGPAYGSFLRAQIGEKDRSSNDRLDKAFNELAAFPWRFPVALMSNSYTVNTVLEDWYKCERKYIWHFTSDFIALCQNVPLWVKYPIRTAVQFKRPIEHRLHELLRVFANRTYPFWSVSVGELMQLVGAKVSGDRFITHVIEPAKIRIEAVTGWEIKLERFPEPRVAPTQSVRFTIIRKPSASLPVGA